jgi:hypothetical protein
MNQSPHKRPLLATVICIYEVAVSIIPVPIVLIYLFGILHSALSIHSLVPRSIRAWAEMVLALAGATALWHMRRAAFFLLATRFGLSLVLLLIRFPHAIALREGLMAHLTSTVTSSPVVRVMFAAICAQWIISAAIVWYAYKVTSPEPDAAD